MLVSNYYEICYKVLRIIKIVTKLKLRRIKPSLRRQ